MKSFFALILFSFLIFSVKAEDNDPYLVKTKNFHVDHFSLKQIDLGITAVIYNPYKVKVKIEEIVIDVFIGDKKLGTITQASDEVKIRKESAFDLPLGLGVKTGPTLKTVFTEGAKMALAAKRVRTDFKGYVKIRALGFVPVKVKIDQSEFFTLKDLMDSGKEKPTEIETKDPQLTKP